MGLDTNSNVEEIRTVQQQDGSLDAPANETRQKQIRDAVSNHDGLTTDEYTTGGTSVEQLPANAVPRGVEVLVTYLSGNSDVVYVGDDTAQPVQLSSGGDAVALKVTDTSQIYIQTPTSGDGVGLVFEGGQ